MNFKEYQSRALETMIVAESQALVYCTLGLCGEIAELQEKIDEGAEVSALAKELGGVEWYIATLAYAGRLAVDGEEWDQRAYAGSPSLVSQSVIASDMAKAAGRIANKVKKTIRDDPNLNIELVLTEGLIAIAGLAQRFAESLRIPHTQVREMNVRELASRRARGVIKGSGDNR